MATWMGYVTQEAAIVTLKRPVFVSTGEYRAFWCERWQAKMGERDDHSEWYLEAMGKKAKPNTREANRPVLMRIPGELVDSMNFCGAEDIVDSGSHIYCLCWYLNKP